MNNKQKIPIKIKVDRKSNILLGFRQGLCTPETLV